MNNKQRNAEAVLVFRPVTLGQCKDNVEAAVIGIVKSIFGVDLLGPVTQVGMWTKTATKSLIPR